MDRTRCVLSILAVVRVSLPFLSKPPGKSSVRHRHGRFKRAEGSFELGLVLQVYDAALNIRDKARKAVQPVRGDSVAAVVGEYACRGFGLFLREALFDEIVLKSSFSSS